jgi:DNA-binding MarR family transcriptional regulator
MMGKSARTLLLVRLLQLKLYNEMVEALRLFELTPLQYMVLSLAGHRGSLSTADLARRFHMTPQSMNEVIAALEAKKLIVRRESPDHRRILHVRLKAAGTRLLQKCDGEVDRIERLAFRDFAPKELVAFRGMIAKALAALDEDFGARRPAAAASHANGGRRASARPQ